MKHLTFLLFFIAIGILCLGSCNSNNQANGGDGYTISGKVKGLNTALVKLKEARVFGDPGMVTIDSVQMVNGTFEFNGKIDHVDRVQLLFGEKYEGDFFLENSDITIEVDIEKADKYGQFTPVVSGSINNDQFREQNEKAQGIFALEKYAVIKELREESRIAYQTKDKTLIQKARDKQAAHRDLMDEQREAYKQTKLQFARENPSSPIAPYILGAQYSEGRMSREELKEFYQIFEGPAKATRFFKEYIEKTYNEVFVSLGVGATAPDFTLPTVEGNELTLSKLNQKYILVDYWASWCVPCRASFPHLKELHNKYKKDGFDVVAIGTADEETKWRKAIEEDQTTWNNVFDASAENRNGANGEVAKKYSVPFLPTTFLLDENLTILGRNLKKEELDVKLVELFGY